MGLCWRTCRVWPILGSRHSLHRPGTQGALCPAGEEWPAHSGCPCRSAASLERPLFPAGLRQASPTSSSPEGQSREQGPVGADPCPGSPPAAGAERLWGQDPGLPQPPPGAACCFLGAGPRGLALLGDSSACRVSEETRSRGAGRRFHIHPLGGRAVNPCGPGCGPVALASRSRLQLSLTQPSGPPSSDPRPRSSRSWAVRDP